MALITQAEYARKIGVSRPYVSKLITKGIITLVDGKIDPVKAEKQRKANSDPVKTVEKTNKKNIVAPVASSQGISNLHLKLLKARAKRELYRAEREQIAYEEEKNRLIEAALVSTEIENVFIAFKSKLLALPTKVSPEVIGLKNLSEIKEVFENAIHECLRELSAPKFDYKESEKDIGSSSKTNSK